VASGGLVVWLVAGYPVWWALGVGQFAFWIFAVPMALELVRRHRAHGLPLPPGFALWALFLVWAVAGLALVGLTAPGTLPGSGGLLGALVRVGTYLALTVLLLYVGTTPRVRLGDRAVAAALAWLCVATVAGGYLGLLAPDFSYVSPVERLLPARLADDEYVQTLLRPASAQVMNVLGYDSPRPKAPWEYTNTWGNMLSLLLPWLAVAWFLGRRGPARWAAAAVAAASVVPIVYSLNRALWAGLVLTGAFVLVHLVRRGRPGAALLCACAASVALMAALASPLMDVVRERAAHPHSDEGRAATSAAAVAAASESPVVGWGTTRDMIGSSASIAVGPSPDCPACGNHTIGNNGQFWLALVAHGWVGTALFLAFPAWTAWRHRNDFSQIGTCSLLTILLLFWYMFFYVALTAPLAVSMIAAALLWRRGAETERTAAAVGGVA
jgi:hypothetical protein